MATLLLIQERSFLAEADSSTSIILVELEAFELHCNWLTTILYVINRQLDTEIMTMRSKLQEGGEEKGVDMQMISTLLCVFN